MGGVDCWSGGLMGRGAPAWDPTIHYSIAPFRNWWVATVLPGALSRFRIGTASPAMPATQTRHEGGVEPPRPDCEVLIDTGISHRGKRIPSAPNRMSGHVAVRKHLRPCGVSADEPIHLGNGRA